MTYPARSMSASCGMVVGMVEVKDKAQSAPNGAFRALTAAITTSRFARGDFRVSGAVGEILSHPPATR